MQRNKSNVIAQSMNIDNNGDNKFLKECLMKVKNSNRQFIEADKALQSISIESNFARFA